jgi:hypothetical protein
MILHYEVGDIVTLKKGHPCGENKWEIMRTGVDIKLKCQGCDRQIWLTRMEFEKRVRRILVGDKWISIIHYKGKEEQPEDKE